MMLYEYMYETLTGDPVGPGADQPDLEKFRELYGGQRMVTR